MTTTLNRATNPKPSSNAGYTTTSGYVRTFETVFGRPAIVSTRAAAGPSSYVWYGRNMGTLRTASTGTPNSPEGLVPVTPGETIQYTIAVGTDTPNCRVTLIIRHFDANGSEMAGAGVSAPGQDAVVNGWQDYTMTVVVPEGASYLYTEMAIQKKSGNTVGGERGWAGRVYIGSPSDYFDGDYPDTLITEYAWTGLPGLSPSYRMDTLDKVDPWTRRWWETLPVAYRRVDATMNEEMGYYPLLRFMNGAGGVAGAMRKISDDMWAGVYTDPNQVPDAALPWLAQMLGITASQRRTTPEKLRQLLVDLTVTGRTSTGTRASIAEVAKRFLTGSKQVSVRPSTTAAHTIIVLVRASEVPGADLAGMAASIRATGVIPAGHDLQVVPADPSWDTWSAAAGTTWNELQVKAPTWQESDSLGVVLEE